jgi:hypothetical protein
MGTNADNNGLSQDSLNSLGGPARIHEVLVRISDHDLKEFEEIGE